MVCRLTRLLDHAIQATVGSPEIHVYPGSIQRKRKEHHDSFGQECKVIRSNSEERPLENSNSHYKDGSAIRRVSSHEDFSLARVGHKADITGHINCVARVSSLPLHERNPVAVSSGTGGHQKHGHHQVPPTPVPATHISDIPVTATTTAVEPELSDDNEHERQRSSERFSRSAVPRPARGRRNPARRQRRAGHHRRTRHSPDTDTDSSSKENEEEERGSSRSPHLHPSGSTTHYNSSEDEADVTNSHSFLQLHTQSQQERERSPSPVASVSPPTPPPLDLKTLHQQVGESEPQPSRRGSGGAGSLVMHHLDPSVPPSPPHEHAGPGRTPLVPPEQKLKILNKQAHSLKKKLKHFEEDFQKEYGYRPSHSDKMSDREMKKVCTELNKIRKDIKQLKVDPSSIDLLMDTSDTKSSSGISHYHKPRTMEEMLQEVEKHLTEKRQHAGRPAKVDELSPEQALDEKVAVQKALLHMEGIFGRPVTKGDRNLVRPLYDRYRALKRLIIRTGQSKLKDSVSELATIHEHETMEFTSSPLPPSLSVSYEADTAETVQPSLPATSETLSANLHSLPLSELLNQQRAAREEKKRLRRSLKEFEEEFQQRTGRKLQKEDRTAVESIYTAYKHTKAKLRLLEALVSKQT